jgi:hypothetical protein
METVSSKRGRKTSTPAVYEPWKCSGSCRPWLIAHPNSTMPPVQSSTKSASAGPVKKHHPPRRYSAVSGPSRPFSPNSWYLKPRISRSMR